METEELKKKYEDLANRGLLPLVFKNISIEDVETNHELRPKQHFASPKFNTRLLNFKFVERTFNV